MRISDWSSDVCSSDLGRALRALAAVEDGLVHLLRMADHLLGLLLMQLLRAAVERIVAAGAQDEVGAAVALDEVAAAGRLQEVLPGESVGIDQSGRASCGERGGQYV